MNTERCRRVRRMISPPRTSSAEGLCGGGGCGGPSRTGMVLSFGRRVATLRCAWRTTFQIQSSLGPIVPAFRDRIGSSRDAAAQWSAGTSLSIQRCLCRSRGANRAETTRNAGARCQGSKGSPPRHTQGKQRGQRVADGRQARHLRCSRECKRAAASGIRRPSAKRADRPARLTRLCPSQQEGG